MVYRLVTKVIKRCWGAKSLQTSFSAHHSCKIYLIISCFDDDDSKLCSSSIMKNKKIWNCLQLLIQFAQKINAVKIQYNSTLPQTKLRIINVWSWDLLHGCSFRLQNYQHGNSDNSSLTLTGKSDEHLLCLRQRSISSVSALCSFSFVVLIVEMCIEMTQHNILCSPINRTHHSYLCTSFSLTIQVVC